MDCYLDRVSQTAVALAMDLPCCGSATTEWLSRTREGAESDAGLPGRAHTDGGQVVLRAQNSEIAGSCQDVGLLAGVATESAADFDIGTAGTGGS